MFPELQSNGTTIRPGRTRGGNAQPRGRFPLRIAPGSTFRHLEIGPEIGRGAFATVYLGRDTLMERTVALKMHRRVPSLSSEMERKLALREARLVGRISSPNVVTLFQVHDLGEAGWLMEMEYVDGDSLERVLEERGRLPIAEALRILRGVLAGLHVAHEHGIAHRDVKPANVLLGRRDGAIKLTDFGLGCTVGDLTASISTIDGLIGTPQYVAPEVIDGKQPTKASDIWSVGVLAYRMLCGRLPFAATNLPELFDAIRAAQPCCMGQSEVCEAMKSVIHDCLHKEPEARPRSPALLLARLEDVTVQS